MKSQSVDGKLITRESICDHFPHSGLTRKERLGSIFSRRVAIQKIGNPNNGKKIIEKGQKGSSRGLGTIIWVRITLRMQWKASQTSKPMKNCCLFKDLEIQMVKTLVFSILCVENNENKNCNFHYSFY